MLEGGSSVLEGQRGAGGRDWSEGKIGRRGDTGVYMYGLKGGEFVRGKVG